MSGALRLTYERRATPLHAARAGAGCAYCMTLVLLALLLDDPLELAAVLLAALAAATLAGAGEQVRGAAPFALLTVILFAAINALVSRNGLTVVARLGELPPFGQLDITLEALVYGAVYGLKILIVLAASLIAAVAVDPDQLLRSMRRVSLRGAVAAALAARMMPVLAADGQRLAEAQRCLAPGARRGRVAILRALAGGSLDRALDYAASLEVRGYAIARRPRRDPRPWSRHDVAFTAAAVALMALGIAARTTGLAHFSADPVLKIALGGRAWLLAAGLAGTALLPFVQRRGVEQ